MQHAVQASGRSVLMYGLRTCIWRVEITRTSFLLEEEMVSPQTGGTLSFTINTFGPSAERVSRVIEVSVFLSVHVIRSTP